MNNQAAKNLRRLAKLLAQRAKLEKQLEKPGISLAVQNFIRAVIAALPIPNH